jgi:regulator of sigma E protease
VLMIVAALGMIGILVFIHEFGHFLFARLFGVGVHVFSLGFGRRLFGFVHKGTDYRVSLLPIGGYVMMEGADPFMDGGEGLDDPNSETAFLNKPVWQRLIIVAAGPAANLVLPIVVFSALYMAGEPQPAAVIGGVDLSSPAHAAGLRAGDRILSVGGEDVTWWTDLHNVLDPYGGGHTVELVVERGTQQIGAALAVPSGVADGEVTTVGLGLSYATPDARVVVDDPASPAAVAGLETFDRISRVGDVEVDSWLGLVAALDNAGGAVEVEFLRSGDRWWSPSRTAVVAPDPGWQAVDLGFADPYANAWGVYPATMGVQEVTEGSAAEELGILPGDRLVVIDGEGLGTWYEVLGRVAAAREGEGDQAEIKALSVSVVRDGRKLDKQITPRLGRVTDAMGVYENRVLLGIARGGALVYGPRTPRFFGFAESVDRAVTETLGLAGFMLEHVGKLVTNEADISKSLGGPVQIFRDAGEAAEQGIFEWARRMGLLSVSLAIINFLPVPVLDGGQFLFYLLEAIRGRPLPLAWRERAQQIGVLFLIALMLSVLAFDITRCIEAPK